MRQALAWVLGFGLSANGLWMLVRPLGWYFIIPGVTGTGPPNLHFIRDIGCAYLVTGASLFWLATRPRQAWPAALVGGMFLSLHASVHVWDTLAGRESTHQLVADLPAVVLPAVLVLALVRLTARDSTKE